MTATTYEALFKGVSTFKLLGPDGAWAALSALFPPPPPERFKPLPRLLTRKQAIEHVGVGASLFSAMVKDGRLPQPVSLTERKKVWDRQQLDKWVDALSSDGKVASNSWDDIHQ